MHAEKMAHCRRPEYNENGEQDVDIDVISLTAEAHVRIPKKTRLCVYTAYLARV